VPAKRAHDLSSQPWPGCARAIAPASQARCPRSRRGRAPAKSALSFSRPFLALNNKARCGA
jgi:hypothetical protein